MWGLKEGTYGRGVQTVHVIGDYSLDHALSVDLPPRI